MPCGAKLRFLGMFGGMRRDTAVCGSRQRSRQRCCEAAFLGCEPWHDSGRTTFSEARELPLPLFTENPRVVILGKPFSGTTSSRKPSGQKEPEYC